MPLAARRRLAFPLVATSLSTAVLLVGGCAMTMTTASNDPGTGSDRPAVLTAPTPATRAELERAVSEAMHGAQVRLADDALTTSSDLVISRVPRRDSAGRPLLGRSTERPEHFHLLDQAGHCILVEDRTGRRWPLRSATCAPAPGR